MEHNSEPEIIESVQGSKTAAITPQIIILRHIDRISKYIFSGEHEPTTKVTNQGVAKTVDRRVIIIQAIEFLIATLTTHYDKDMKAKQKEFDEAMVKVEKGLLTTAINTEAYNQALIRTGDKQETMKMFKDLYNNNSMMPINKESPYYERYIVIKYINYMSLFKAQNELLNRIDYLAGIAGSGGMEE